MGVIYAEKPFNSNPFKRVGGEKVAIVASQIACFTEIDYRRVRVTLVSGVSLRVRMSFAEFNKAHIDAMSSCGGHD